MEHFSRYSWLITLGAVIAQTVIILLAGQTAVELRPLAPTSAMVLFFSVISAAGNGVYAGLAVALLGTLTSFLTIADLETMSGIVGACISTMVWCGAALLTGIFAQYLRRQVERRETVLRHALARSTQTRRQMERVMEFCPRFQQGESVQEVLDAICQTALETFGADGVHLYASRKERLELLAFSPESVDLKRGLILTLDKLPGLADRATFLRPIFIHDLRTTPLSSAAREIQQKLRAVSIVRIPIVSAGEMVGLLVVGWDHLIEHPPEDLLALMQRFADQAAIAWQNALRAEAQRRADSLHATLRRLLELAPGFHITGTSQEVAQAVCEAALATFDCTGAALYEIRGDQISLLDCRPPLGALRSGTMFPLNSDAPYALHFFPRFPTFVPDVKNVEKQVLGVWPVEAICQTDAGSALYVPLRFDERGPHNLLVLFWNHGRERPDPGFLLIVERFADQVALALTNASAEQLHTRLEASLLPARAVEHPGLAVVMRYRTAESQLRLGGDFLDSTLTREGGLQFVVGDVTGHGPDAAALGATLRSSWKALALAGESLPGIAEALDEILLAERRQTGTFATLLTGRINLSERILQLLNAGHPSPVLLGQETVSLEAPPSPPLGFQPSSAWNVHLVPLPERWRLFCYTDGLLDIQVAPGSSRQVSQDRLLQLVDRRIGDIPYAGESEAEVSSVGKALDILMEEIRREGGGRFADDVAILALSTLGLC